MNDKIAAAITPQLPGGAPPPAGGAPPGQGAPGAQQQPPAAPAPGYAPDPVVMQNNAKTLLQAQQMEDLANDFNYNMRVISSGFGTAQQQASKMAGLNSGPGSTDLLGRLGQIQGIQKDTFQQQQESLAMAAMMDPKFLNQTAATTGLTPQQIKTFLLGGGKIGDLFAGVIGAGGDATQQDMRRDRMSWIQQHQVRDKNGDPIPGKYDQPMPEELQNTEKYKLKLAEDTKTGKEAADARFNATQSFHAIDPTLKSTEENLAWLKAHSDAVVRAVHTPETASNLGGTISAVTGMHLPGVDQEALDARSRIDWLKKNLYADRFTGTKNVRSNTEANNLGAAASNLDNIKNSPQQIIDEVNRLYDNAQMARGNLHAAAGKKVPGRYAGKVDPAYLDPTSPLYNKATQGVTADLSHMGDKEADAAYTKLEPGDDYIGPDGVMRTK
jgi:hypothetical protein